MHIPLQKRYVFSGVSHHEACTGKDCKIGFALFLGLFALLMVLLCCLLLIITKKERRRCHLAAQANAPHVFSLSGHQYPSTRSGDTSSVAGTGQPRQLDLTSGVVPPFDAQNQADLATTVQKPATIHIVPSHHSPEPLPIEARNTSTTSNVKTCSRSIFGKVAKHAAPNHV